jgi:hypothetical protein
VGRQARRVLSVMGARMTWCDTAEPFRIIFLAGLNSTRRAESKRPRGSRRVAGGAIMSSITYTKGLFKAEADVRLADNGLYQGWVSLSRDDGEDPDDTIYEVESTSASELEAFEEAKALAHRILGEIEL